MAEQIIVPPTQIRTVRDIDYCLKQFDAEDELTFDFTGTRFIRPVGVVSLLAVLSIPRVSDTRFRLLGESEVAVYLRQVGAFEVMREQGYFTDIQPEDVIPFKLPVRPMVPCTHFRTEDDIDKLASDMEHRFSTEFAGLASLLQPCHNIFSELAINVVSHAESDGGYVLAQQYNYKSGSVVDIAVADRGIGIQTSLLKNPELGPFSSDCDAINLAMLEGISSLQDKYRGYGLTDVAFNVKSVEDRSMTIRSGNGILTLRGDGSIVMQKSLTTFFGTIVNVRVPCGQDKGYIETKVDI